MTQFPDCGDDYHGSMQNMTTSQDTTTQKLDVVIDETLHAQPSWFRLDDLIAAVQLAWPQRLPQPLETTALRYRIRERIRHLRSPDGERSYECVDNHEPGKKVYKQLELFEKLDFQRVISDCKKVIQTYQRKANRMARQAQQKGWQLRLPYPEVKVKK